MEIKSEIKLSKNAKADAILKGEETQAEFTLAEITDFMSESLETVLDGAAYEALNQINKIALEKSNQEEFVKALSEQRQNSSPEFKSFADEMQKEELESKQDKVNYVIRKSQSFTFPGKYYELSTNNFFLKKLSGRFPTAPEGRNLWHANRMDIAGRNFLLSAGVSPDISPDSEEIEDFFQMILEDKPVFICAIGRFVKEEINETDARKVNYDFQNYIKNGTYGKKRTYKVESKVMQDNNNIIEFTVTDKQTKKQHISKLINIEINDNFPVSLNEAGYKTFFYLHNIMSEKDLIMVHCGSGVGRTAFFTMMIIMCDVMNKDKDLRQTLEKILIKDHDGKFNKVLENPLLEKTDLERLRSFTIYLQLNINIVRNTRAFLQDKFRQISTLPKAFILMFIAERKLYHDGLRGLLEFPYKSTSFKNFSQELKEEIKVSNKCSIM